MTLKLPELLAATARHEPMCRALARDLVTSWSVAWTWDPVYCAASAPVDGDALADLSARLTRDLSGAFDRKTLKTASPRIKDIVMWAGGLEGRQRAFIAPAPGDPRAAEVFATLWPWTEDEGCTVRVGLYHRDARLAERQALGDVVRAWFGLP